MTKMYQLRRLIFGKATSLAPSISGSTKLPRIAGTAGNEDEEHHRHAVHREELVVGVGADEVAGRRRQLEADQRREQAADEEREGDDDEVHDADALVVLGQEPRGDRVPDVQIVDARRGERHFHGVTCSPAAGAAAGRPAALARQRRRSSCSDFTYSMSAITLSSLTRPWNVGITGW